MTKNNKKKLKKIGKAIQSIATLLQPWIAIINLVCNMSGLMEHQNQLEANPLPQVTHQADEVVKI